MKQQRCESEQFIVINERVKRFARDFYIKRKEGEREQDSGDTDRERECVCVREVEHCRERKKASAIK